MGLPTIERDGKRYVEYNPTIALEIVERIADGELLRNITSAKAEQKTVSKQTFMQWVATVPELRKAYDAAMQMSAHAFEEKAINAAENLIEKKAGKDMIAATNTLISQYRWSATRRNPTKYSDKGDTKIVVPIYIQTTLDMGGKGGSDVEDNSVYDLTLNAKDVEDGEFRELPDGSSDSADAQSGQDQLEDDTSKHEFFRNLIKPDTPVDGSERQPLLEAAKKKPGAPKGPRKRVLTPRIQKNG